MLHMHWQQWEIQKNELTDIVPYDPNTTIIERDSSYIILSKPSYYGEMRQQKNKRWILTNYESTTRNRWSFMGGDGWKVITNNQMPCHFVSFSCINISYQTALLNREIPQGKRSPEPPWRGPYWSRSEKRGLNTKGRASVGYKERWKQIITVFSHCHQ